MVMLERQDSVGDGVVVICSSSHCNPDGPLDTTMESSDGSSDDASFTVWTSLIAADSNTTASLTSVTPELVTKRCRTCSTDSSHSELERAVVHRPLFRSVWGLRLCLVLAVATVAAPSLYRHEHSNGTSPVTLRNRPTEARNATPDALSVAWLLLYLGTTESIVDLVQTMSGTTTASNYALVHPISVYPNATSGPFVVNPSLPLPRHYILTHTYCGTLCLADAHCLPVRPDSEVALDFRLACTSGRVKQRSDGTVRSVAYDATLPQRAIHVVQHPFRTVWNRWQLSMLQHTDHSDPLSRRDTGAWCRSLDERHYEPVLVAYAHVPCASEWYRYIQWHNMVLSVISNHLVSNHHHPTAPTWLTVWMENVTSTWTDVMDLLQLPSDMVPLHHRVPSADDPSTDDRVDVWDATTKRAAAHMMHDLASNATWAVIRHYLEPYLSVDEVDEPPRINSVAASFSDELLALVDDAWAYNEKYVATTPLPPDDADPQVVWLLSFPNSGTSYTLMNIEQMANVTTGTNYAKDWSTATLIRPDSPQGPFFHKPDMRRPHHVLTKTHCHGYCDDCGPRVYVASSNAVFQQGCVRSELAHHGGDAYYNASIPTKAVHLFRNPFDNIVARMHLAVKKREKMGWSPERLATFGNSPQGLTAWCDYLDAKYATAEQDYFSSTLNEQWHGLPCHADWYRYVMWHNHAFAMTSSLRLPVHVLWYEDYTNRFDETVSDLLAFLNVTPRQPPVEFYVGKSYEHFFDVAHARHAAALVRALGSNETWAHVRHYFEPYL